MFLEQKYENIRVFLSDNFQFLEAKFSIYLNRRVFVMNSNFVNVAKNVSLLRRRKENRQGLSGFGFLYACRASFSLWVIRR